ncbi:MAG: adenylate/guanylate cyclase domain-containing protein [Nitrospirota bacterium]
MRTPLSKAITLGLLTGIAGIMLGILPFGLRIEENSGLDLLFKIRGEKKVPSDAVVVSIDKESSEHLSLPDNPDKWPRSLHARLVENLSKEGVRVIAFDVHFIEHRSPEEDGLFARIIDEAGNVVLCEPLKTKEVPISDDPDAQNHNIIKLVKPIDPLSHTAAATAPFVLPRIPFKVNRYWTFQAGAGDSPTLPVVVFQLYTMPLYENFIDLMYKVSPHEAEKLPPDGDTAMKTMNIKGLIMDIRGVFESEPLLAARMSEELENSETLAADAEETGKLKSLIKMYAGSNNRYINFYGPPGTITTIPYYQALQIRNGAVGNRQIDLKNKVVFVGLSEVLLAERKDSFYTVFSQANGVFISGVEIAATAFSNLIEDRPVKPLGSYFFILVLLFWGIALGMICRMSSILVALLSVVGLSIAYLVLAAYQFKMNDVLYPVVIPLVLQGPFAFFGSVLWNYIDVNKERQNIRKAFEHYLPKEVVDQLAKDVAHIKTGSRVVYGICLFTDAQQYTSLSETMEPHELGKFMNKYYEAMFNPVKKHGGFVSGVIGDSMLALWVSASSDAALRDKACLAAIDIAKELEKFDQSSDGAKLKTRIGLHCGQILLGHIGALDHYEYTPMGDIVNTASRIEGLNKHVGTT